MIWLWLSAGLMAITAFLHSYFGEKRLIGPILGSDLQLVKTPLARMVIRLAWHLTSILMLINAALMVWPGTPVALVAATAATWLVMGLIDAVLTKGKHIGWPPITAAGVFGLIGSVL